MPFCIRRVGWLLKDSIMGQLGDLMILGLQGWEESSRYIHEMQSWKALDSYFFLK